ncbi:MAG: hypothetical protein AAF997_23680, partial [Myxococcota bacterium]
PVPYEDGSDIEFVVLLADGTSALEGKGRVRAAVDGGAERVPETRYDVVVEALALEGRFEVVFESLVMARQAVSEPPPAPEDYTADSIDDAVAAEDGVAEEASAEADEPTAEVDGMESDAPELEISGDEVFSVPPDDVMSVAPEARAADDLTSDEDQADVDEEDAPEAYASAESEVADDSDVAVEATEEEADVDVEMAVEEASSDDVSFEDDEEAPVELSMDAQATLEKYANAHEGPAPAEQAYEDVVAESDESDASFEEAFIGEVDEDGQPLVAAEPNVGGPVPKPSIAAPPEAPPAPTGLNLVPPPEGLTRPSRTAAEEALLDSYEEAGADEESGLFRYENGLPIPSRPPLPDLNPARRVAVVEANDIDDVEDSEPPEAHDDYEEIRLSELAESAEEG